MILLSRVTGDKDILHNLLILRLTSFNIERVFLGRHKYITYHSTNQSPHHEYHGAYTQGITD